MNLNDYQTLTETVGIVRLDDREVVEISGCDSLSFLHKMTTNDFEILSVGNGCEAFATNAQGKVQGFFVALKRADSIWLEMAVGQADSLIAHLDMYVIREDVKFNKLAETHSLLAVIGPGLSELAAASNWEIPAAEWGHSEQVIAGQSVVVVRTPWLGPLSVVIVGTRESLQIVETALSDRATVCDPGLANILRIENGFPNFGDDINSQNLPQELARDESAISFNKGCYIGQETVARINSLGRVNKHLVQVQFPAGDSPAVGMELLRSDKVVGQVTSVAQSPRVSAPLALAMVRREASAVGSELQSAVGVATVVEFKQSLN